MRRSSLRRSPPKGPARNGTSYATVKDPAPGGQRGRWSTRPVSRAHFIDAESPSTPSSPNSSGLIGPRNYQVPGEDRRRPRQSSDRRNAYRGKRHGTPHGSESRSSGTDQLGRRKAGGQRVIKGASWARHPVPGPPAPILRACSARTSLPPGGNVAGKQTAEQRCSKGSEMPKATVLTPPAKLLAAAEKQASLVNGASKADGKTGAAVGVPKDGEISGANGPSVAKKRSEKAVVKAANSKKRKMSKETYGDGSRGSRASIASSSVGASRSPKKHANDRQKAKGASQSGPATRTRWTPKDERVLLATLEEVTKLFSKRRTRNGYADLWKEVFKRCRLGRSVGALQKRYAQIRKRDLSGHYENWNHPAVQQGTEGGSPAGREIEAASPASKGKQVKQEEETSASVENSVVRHSEGAPESETNSLDDAADDLGEDSEDDSDDSEDDSEDDSSSSESDTDSDEGDDGNSELVEAALTERMASRKKEIIAESSARQGGGHSMALKAMNTEKLCLWVKNTCELWSVVDKFSENAINGELLLTLDDETLGNQLGLKPLQILRLRLEMKKFT